MKGGNFKMTEELKQKLETLENALNILIQKVNEVVSCLEDNNLSRKVSIDYIYSEEEKNEIETANKTAEEKAEETPNK